MRRRWALIAIATSVVLSPCLTCGGCVGRAVRVADYEFILPPARIDGEWGHAILHELEARGGHWEGVFGDLLIVCIPPGVNLDPTE